MLNMTEANWPVLALVVALALLIALWLLSRRRKGLREREYQPDVLDEGAAPAQRNQALIDAAPAAQIVPPPFAGSMGGIGEVVAVAAQEEVIAAAAPPSPTATAADDLSRIKGLGPKLQVLLPTLGLTTFAQIAALTEADLADLDSKLGAFAGRPARDQWVEQARHLAGGDITGFEAQFGKV